MFRLSSFWFVQWQFFHLWPCQGQVYKLRGFSCVPSSGTVKPQSQSNWKANAWQGITMRRSIFNQVSHHCQNFSLCWHFRNLLDHKLRPETYPIQTDALYCSRSQQKSNKNSRTDLLYSHGALTFGIAFTFGFTSGISLCLRGSIPLVRKRLIRKLWGTWMTLAEKESEQRAVMPPRESPLNPLINFFLHMWRFLWPGNGQPRSIDPQEFSRNNTRDRQANSKKFACGLRRVSSLTIWGEWTMSKTWDASPWNMSSEKRCDCACLQHWKYLSQKRADRNNQKCTIKIL